MEECNWVGAYPSRIGELQKKKKNKKKKKEREGGGGGEEEEDFKVRISYRPN
jgi:hypothetical protein